MTAGPNGMLSLEDVVELETLGGYSRTEIDLAGKVGMYAWDIAFIDNYCSNNDLIMVFRTNNLLSRSQMLRFDASPKKGNIHGKTKGGIIVKFGKNYYSDYDLMSVWRSDRKKIDTNNLSRLNSDSTVNKEFNKAEFDKINYNFKAFGQTNRIQHGANDDYYDKISGNFLGARNVSDNDIFLLCGVGASPIVRTSMKTLEVLYRVLGFTSDLVFTRQDGTKVHMGIWPYYKINNG